MAVRVRSLPALVAAAALGLAGAPAQARAAAPTTGPAPQTRAHAGALDPGVDGERRPFPSGHAGREWLHAVWTDGTVMATSTHSGVRLTCRTGQVSYSPSSIRGITAIGGGGRGEALTIAAIGEDGGVIAWRRGGWEVAQAPTIEREPLRALVIDEAGRIYAAGERHALYVKDGDAWAIHRYPRSEVTRASVRAIARIGDGGLLLAGDGGLLLTFKDGVTRRYTLPAGALAGDLQAAWASPGGEALWLISKTDLIRVDLRRGTARSVDVPSFGQVRALAGVSTPAGDRLLVAAQSELSIHDGDRFLRVAGDYVFAEGLAIDPIDGSLYVASRDGLRRVVVDEPGLAAAAGQGVAPGPCPLPGEAEVAAEDEASVDAAAEVEAEVTPSKRRRGRARKHMPSFRLSIGPALVRDPAGPARAAFALDLFLGAQLAVRRGRLAIWPELGYAYSRSPLASGHLIALGVGPLYGNEYAGVAVMPKLLVGSASDLLAVGVRTSVVATFFYDVFSIEGGHQYLRFGGQGVHEGRLMFSINILPVMAVMLIAGAIRGFRRR